MALEVAVPEVEVVVLVLVLRWPIVPPYGLHMSH